MKKLISFLLSVCLVLTFSACSEAESQPTTVATEETEIPTTMETIPQVTEVINLTGPMTAVSLPTDAEIATAEDGTTIFQYTYQNMSLTLSAQATADLVIVDFLSRLDAARTTADSLLASAQSAYDGSANWIPYLCQIVYNPQRIDRGVMSLYGTMVTYSGASHPETSCISANYDLLTGDVLTLGSILTGEDASGKLCDLVVDNLNKIAQEKYLRSGFEADVKARFAVDPSYDEDWYFSNNGLCFYFAPYEIAPYSSGVIISEIPYAELAGLIMDEYFPAEQQALTGTIQQMPFSTDDAAQFPQISELILNQEGEMYLLYCDSSIQNVSIHVNNAATDLNYVAYAAEYLNPGDAIMIQYDPSLEDHVVVEYLSCGEYKTYELTH